jgi:type III pantothenate kinase
MTAAPRALIDLGNHRVKLLLADARAPQVWTWRDESSRRDFASALTEAMAPGEAIGLCSSSPQAEAALAPAWQSFALWKMVPDDVPLARQTEGTGLDRLMATYAAWSQAGAKEPVLVASLGTAFTLDVVSADGRFLGGAIGPGLGLQQQALVEGCPHLDLPQASRENPPRRTATAVDAGTRRALAASLMGLREEFAQSLQKPPLCFVHGGDAELLAPLLPQWKLRHHLVLSGMRILCGQPVLGATWGNSSA